ncbi:MAG: formate dehydrogenase accessory protein FdhE [Proteobacteria bacterium]|nr:formate dehydrogenase accessory protein FdhE [Pseudomonadota bacterium]
MNSSPTHRQINSPEDIRQRSGLEVPPLLLPDPRKLFAERALRLRQLAAGHAMRDYLMLMAVVCEAQHARLQQYPEVPLPDAAQAAAAGESGEPLLAAEHWPRAGQWRTELRALLRQVLDKLPSDSPARTGVQAVMALPDVALEQQADRLLAGITLGLDLAAAPLVAAGLQLYFTHLVAATGAAQPQAFQVPPDATRCPCCASLATASITRVGGQQDGQRYLHCALCSAQWHMNRIQCTHCLATQGIHYQSLQALADDQPSTRRAAVEAETCDGCHHYLKTMHVARDLHVEPLADDLATLTLDLLVSEAGFERHGVNLLLLFGDGDVQAGGG